MKINGEYITLGQLVKICDFASSGGEVKHIINELKIYVNGEKENRRGKKIYRKDIVLINNIEYKIE